MVNWPIYQLADVTDLITCGVAKRPNYVDSGVPFLSAKNVKNGRIIWAGYQHITKADHDELTKNNKPLLGDILYTRVGSYGEAAVVDNNREFSVFVSLTLIKPKHEILYNQFLKYHLNSSQIKQLAKSSISGSGVGNLNVGTVRKFPIPLPPIPEQRRIVAILDQAFADIERARANAEKNLKNARELFDSYFYEVFNDIGSKVKWQVKSIGNTCTLATGGTPSKTKPEYYEKGNIKWLVSGDIHKKEIFDCNGRINELGLKNSNARYLPENSVMIALNGQGKTRGSVALLRTVATCNQSLVSISPNDTNELNPEYLYTNLDGRYDEIRKITGDDGNDRRGLNMPLIKAIRLPLPSISEQKAIVQKLDRLSNSLEGLTAGYQEKLDSLEELKKSLLQKAFSGELTKTEGYAA